MYVFLLYIYVGIQDVILSTKLKKCGRPKGAKKKVICRPSSDQVSKFILKKLSSEKEKGKNMIRICTY